MKFDAVLFDMDGTVLDTLADLKNAINAALGHFGLPELSMEQVRAYVGNGSRRLVEQAVPEGTREETVEQVLAWYKPWYDAHCRVMTGPYEGILTLLERLKAAGLRLAIISNKPDSAVRQLAEEYFPGLIELAVGENESAGLRRKPWPDMIRAVTERMGLDKDRCLYVGDSEVDIITARNAALPCASVCWGFRSRRELIEAGAEVLIDTPEVLERFILV